MRKSLLNANLFERTAACPVDGGILSDSKSFGAKPPNATFA